MPIPDAARLSIFDSLVSSIADEMGATLRHTALSPNIKERADFSCAVFDAEGQLLAQAAHIPVHLGAMPESVRAVADLAPWQPGDLAILNDPFLGGTHLPDVTMVSPVFAAGIANPIVVCRQPCASGGHRRDGAGLDAGRRGTDPGGPGDSAAAALSRRRAARRGAAADPAQRANAR